MDKRVMRQDKTVYVGSDTFSFRVEKVPYKKYDNWLKMRKHLINTSDFTTHGFPYILQIEPTSFCNVSCDLCPAAVNRNELHRPPRHMRFNEFKRLIDDVEDYLLYIILWDWGEPFMNPELPDMISYASSKGIKIITSTNGTNLHDQALMEVTLNSGLSALIVAVDSLENKPYTGFRKGLRIEKVIDGLKKLVALKKQLKADTLINLRMVIMKGNEHELPAIRRLAKKLKVDRFSVKTCNLTHRFSFTNYPELIPDNPKCRRYVYQEGSYEPVRIKAQCSVIWYMGFVHSDGDVVACGYDYTGKQLKAGNIFEKSFTQIWNGPEYQKLRRKIYHEKGPDFMCRECYVNFIPSGQGWFPEICDFNRSFSRRIGAFCKKVIHNSII